MSVLIDSTLYSFQLSLSWISTSNLSLIITEPHDSLSFIRNIIHRDVKPSNILVNTQGQLKLTDYGITKELRRDQLGESFIGTISYMSPERIKCADYSFEVDFWSLAITLIVAVTGNHPYPLTGGLYTIMKAIVDKPHPQLSTTFPTSPDFEDFIKRCLNAPAHDATTADAMLHHPFIVSAIQRGVLSNDKPVVLSPPPQPIRMEVCSR